MQAIPIKEDDPTFPIHCCNKAFLIKDKFHTEVIRIVFSDKIVFMITQVNSLGGIVIKAEQDTNMSGNNFLEDFDDSSNYSMEPTYSIKTIFGKRAPSIESPQSDTFIDIEGIFTRRLIQQLYEGNNQTTKQQPFMMMGFEQHVPLSVLAKPLMVEVAFSKEFSDLLKEPSIGRELMKELINCIVNKL